MAGLLAGGAKRESLLADEGWILYHGTQENIMKDNVRIFAGQIIGDVAVLLCAISLLFPASASVLCIAPGHVAIEDLNAECCSLSKAPDATIHHRGNGFNMAGNCRNCTDLLISLNERGATSKSDHNAGAGSFACERIGNRTPMCVSPGLFRRNTFDVPDASPPSPATPSLRC